MPARVTAHVNASNPARIIPKNLSRYKHSGSGENSKMIATTTTTKQAISLEQLLVRHSAPSLIDYLAIDIEGSELPVLRNFPFDRYQFRALSLECDGLIWDEITTLLTGAGYVEVQNPFNNHIAWERCWRLAEDLSA